MIEELADAVCGEPEPPDIVLEALLVRRYGVRLRLTDIAEALRITTAGIKTQLRAGVFPIPTYLEHGKRWADYRDVARYIDKCAREAREEAAERRRKLQRDELARTRRPVRRKKPSPPTTPE